MRILNKENFYSVLPKVNLLLSFAAVVLAVYWVYRIISPYRVNIQQQARPNAAVVVLSQQMSVPVPAFEADNFRKVLFIGASGKKNVVQEKRALIFLGASLGQKNIAVIRDTRANKDFYCTQGDKVGEFKVLSISKEKVVLESDGQTLEITR